MTATRSGIPTTYHEQRFRSRLEARWAAFFDLVGWRWTYEPFDTTGWIPDFLVHGPHPFLVEVGPCSSLDEYRAKAVKPLAHHEHPTLVLGTTPVALEAVDPGFAGLLVNEFPSVVGPAYWEACRAGELTVYGDHVARPCDHVWRASGPSNLEALWRQAGSVVQWKPR